ncbi:protein MpSCD [Marchantia polymorpha subsp. ruderalis]|uniref:UDENN domain-containing protein n=3 Tax=Marchantia polymorpha TaxID=3197 RepID=A0AAF6BKF1_MARPO|nr:hypothetical protein MARPO_0058s0028 [Marchantia polymorpha]BBN12485.1 hypothetical protein Mp_5g20500 [Marchantia polymorpha subsp. ruderalis]|eukprot:PTQ37238.1 hypothetical protein MARPO_0058s0028 [Marchantia polymorpha]
MVKTNVKARVVEYFVVCGLGPDLQTTENQRGFHGTIDVKYQPALLDQFPSSTNSDIPPPPPQLPLCVLPGGVEFYSNGPSPSDESSHPRSYPIVLTDGDGSKIYVSCVAFRDPVDDDVAQAYRIPANSYVDKCICVVSHSPSFQVFREALEELHRLCFSNSGASKPLWDIVSHMVLGVPLPGPGHGQVLFAVENFLLNVEAPPSDGLPHADMSFQPLVQCLDIDNVIRLFTAILLERRVLLRASKYSVLTMVAEALCHLIYPIKWQHVYIPVLFYAGVEYIDAPTPYLMGLHSGVDTTGLTMDGVVDVDLDKNKIVTSTDESIPEIPEIELGRLRNDLLQLVHPNLAHLDRARTSYSAVHEAYIRRFSKPWSSQHDRELRIIFLKFFATILYGYRDFVDYSLPEKVFNTGAFLKKRSRMTSRDTEPMVAEFLSSQGFMEFLERGYGSAEAGPNLVDKIQEAMGRGQDPSMCLPEPHGQPEFFTVSDTSTQTPASRGRHVHDRFPAVPRTPAQEEKRKAILAAVNNTPERPSRPVQTSAPSPGRDAAAQAKFDSLNPEERAAERDRMVLDIKVKLQGLWRRLLMLGATDDPLGSFEFGTIFALIESDAEGIGGSGFVECIREHISMGWQCKLTDEQFIAVKELIKTTVSRATSRDDMVTVRDSLEIAFQVHKKDMAGIPDYIQRHLGTLPVWNDPRFWEGYFDVILERAEQQTGSNFQNYASLVTEQLIALAQHMAGLGLSDAEAWSILETLAQKNNLGSKQLIKLRGILAHLELLSQRYWGTTPTPAPAVTPQPNAEVKEEDRVDSIVPPSETAGIGRSWVQSMFSREKSLRAVHSRNGRELTSGSSEVSIPPPIPEAGPRKSATGMRILRGHKGAITALHPGTRTEVGDFIGDHEESGYFISGSADCTIKLWDPAVRGHECRATFNGHTGPIRAITSDRLRVVTGSDDQTVLVWDKNGGQLQEELKGHENRVNCVRMLSGERVLTAGYDGTARMWDVRTDQCVATVGQHSSAILCMDYEDSTGHLAAAGMDGEISCWDIRAGKQMHKLIGHTSWIRSLRKVGDVIISGSDDWTARMWSVSRGSCDSILSCHKGAVTCVDLCVKDGGVITGSADGMVRLWERDDGSLRSVKVVAGVHSAPILSIKAGDKWLAVGAADNSMSLFNRVGNQSSVESWQLYRTPPRSAATVRCVTSDVERGRIISGARNGLLRLWEPVSSV